MPIRVIIRFLILFFLLANAMILPPSEFSAIKGLFLTTIHSRLVKDYHIDIVFLQIPLPLSTFKNPPPTLSNLSAKILPKQMMKK